MINKTRHANKNDLAGILDLYQYLNPDDPRLVIDEKLADHWNEICRDPYLVYFVAEEEGKIVATCNLSVIKNLTRSARPCGLIENVVTHPAYRRHGHGTAVLQKALSAARERDCYKVMLMTGRKEESTLNFYEKAGFHRGEKTGFIIRF